VVGAELNQEPRVGTGCEWCLTPITDAVQMPAVNDMLNGLGVVVKGCCG